MAAEQDLADGRDKGVSTPADLETPGGTSGEKTA